MAKTSAGLVLYRLDGDGGFEILIVHPGGPLWKNKDAGSWSIPKGEYLADEDPLGAAKREFFEEPRTASADRGRVPLGEVRQSGGKRVLAWAVRGEFVVENLTSNEFEMEWPPRSGKHQSFPEIDRAQWCDADQAGLKLIAAQVSFVDLGEFLQTDV